VALVEAIALAIAAAGAGTLGTLLGLGGGVILIPIFTLVFGIPLKTAVAASAISVVANSISGSRLYLRSGFINIRLALVLMVATSSGAFVGGLLAVSLPVVVLKAGFGTLLLGIAWVMARRNRTTFMPAASAPLPADPYQLGGRYHDRLLGDTVRYVPVRLSRGWPLSALAGVASGLFGIGGGPVTVPVMNALMRVPLKAAASTSSFMVGLTASVSAFVYYDAGYVNATVVVPAVFGVVIGARLGARLATRLSPVQLSQVFVVVMAALAVSMYVDAARSIS
jgi:hypothetical protein